MPMTVYHKSGFLKWSKVPMRDKYTLTLSRRELIAILFGLFWLCCAVVLATKYAEVKRINEQLVQTKTVSFSLPSRPGIIAPTNLNLQHDP